MECELCDYEFEPGSSRVPICNLCWNPMVEKAKALELQVSELQKYRAGAPEALKTLANAIEDRDNKLRESERLLGDAVALVRESRQYAGVDWMVKADNFLSKIEKRVVPMPICDKEYAATEDTYAYCGKEFGHDGKCGKPEKHP